MHAVRFSGRVRWTRKYDTLKLDGRPIILCLGDSFTWGVGVGQHETFAAGLQAEFPEFQVLNAGVPGANVRDMRLVFEHFLRLNVKAILVTILDVDMVRARNVKFQQEVPNCELSWDDESDYLRYDAVVEHNLGNLQKILEAAGQHGICAGVVVWPRNIYRAKFQALAQKIEAVTTTCGATYFPDYDQYLALFHTEQLIVSQKNWHPSILGHQLAAQWLVPQVKKWGVV